MTITKRQKNIFLGILFLILVLAGAFILIKKYQEQQPPPQVVSVYPTAGQTATSRLPEITITVDRSISPRQVSLSSEPSFEYERLKVEDPKKLKYLPKKILEGNTTYNIHLKFNSGGEYSWSFTTREGVAGAVPGWTENFQRLNQQYDQQYPLDETNIYNSIIDQMPYYNSDFWIEYAQRSKTFSVHLCQEPFAETRKMAENWLDQQGRNKLSKLTLQIEWLYGCEPPKIIPQNLSTP